jgi:hypothetical protein
MIRTRKYTLTVNNHYKTIFIARSGDESGKVNFFDFNELRKLLQADSAIITVGNVLTERMLSVTLNNDPRIKRYEIFYSPVTYLISHLSILVRDENKPDDTAEMKLVKVYYSAYRKPVAKRGNYTEKIIRVQGKRLIPAEKYKNYQIISQL